MCPSIFQNGRTISCKQPHMIHVCRVCFVLSCLFEPVFHGTLLPFLNYSRLICYYIDSFKLVHVCRIHGINIVYPIYKFLANSKWIYVPGSVIPTISILDNTSDTTCVELALIETWCIAVLGTTIGCKEWHLISLLLIQCRLNRVDLCISQSTWTSSICMQIYPFFDLSVPRSIYLSIYLSVCCPVHLHSFFLSGEIWKDFQWKHFLHPILPKNYVIQYTLKNKVYIFHLHEGMVTEV